MHPVSISDRTQPKEPLNNSTNVLRESVGRYCQASRAGNGQSLAKRDNDAVAPDWLRPERPPEHR
ncbi:MAG: hypothetical protein PsegKO_11810 [Pseudohongiellaceae bacterium]